MTFVEPLEPLPGRRERGAGDRLADNTGDWVLRSRMTVEHQIAEVLREKIIVRLLRYTRRRYNQRSNVIFVENHFNRNIIGVNIGQKFRRYLKDKIPLMFKQIAFDFHINLHRYKKE